VSIRTVPFDPLKAVLEMRFGNSGVLQASTLGHRYPRTVQRWRSSGRLSLRSAEDVCDILGMNPREIWGLLWDEILICSAPGCDRLAQGELCHSHYRRLRRVGDVFPDISFGALRRVEV